MPNPPTRSVLAFAFLVLAGVARGDEIKVDSATFPRPFLAGANEGDVEGVIEASAVEPIGDGKLLLVAHDKQPGLRVVEASTGRLVGPPLPCDGFPEGARRDPKWEGMARDSCGHYYVVGAHSGKDDAQRNPRTYALRFRLKGGDSPTIDPESVRTWRPDDALIKALRAEGLDAAAVARRKIEGLAVREHGGRTLLVFGLREPDDLVRAFAADITAAPPNGGSLTLTRLFTFRPGTREGVRSQLTSLDYLPAWGGFVVVTATEDKQNAFHGNTLWFLADDRIPPSGLAEPVAFHVFEAAMKAEGLCTLPGATPSAARLLVTFDNDPHATHIPSRFQVLTVSRHP
ncbi:MAG TPA: hypothetical protein VG406_23085 [Isosphaeraceae bacterium]|jgi:hypothetical protein|nr:hypothetical protein [Isosphaeraceae bacterium]